MAKTFAELKVEIGSNVAAVLEPTILAGQPINTGNGRVMQAWDVPVCIELNNGAHRKTTQTVYVYTAQDGSEEAVYAGKIVENEPSGTVESDLDKGRSVLRDLIVNQVDVPELGGRSITEYKLVRVEEIAGKSAVVLRLRMSDGEQETVAMRMVAGDLVIDPAE